MPYLILRPDCGGASSPVPVEGAKGILGMATWNKAHQCHALELSNDVYEANARAFQEFLPKHDRMAVLYVGSKAQQDSDITKLLNDYRTEGESDASVLLRILSDANKLHKYRPTHGKRPTTFLDPVI